MGSGTCNVGSGDCFVEPEEKTCPFHSSCNPVFRPIENAGKTLMYGLEVRNSSVPVEVGAKRLETEVVSVVTAHSLNHAL